jgi:hypothetical protein
LCCAHGRQGIEQQARISQTPALSHNAARQQCSGAVAARSRHDVQALDFSVAGSELPQAGATEHGVLLDGQQESARRRRVLAGQMRQFVRKVLEREIQAQRRGIFFDESACLKPIIR